MRPEERLLFNCARTHLDDAKAVEVRRILSRDLDWARILQSSLSYGIMPLLFHNLKGIADEGSVPQPVMERLARFHHSIGLRNMQIYNELCKVLRVIEDEGIPVILLKGVALAQTVYPDMALRPMSDIDLLVKRADLDYVSQILSGLAYVPSSKYPVDWYEKHHHSVPYRNLHKHIIVEVHHNIAPEPFMSRISADSLWEDTQTVSISGIDASILSPENLILHLCLHMADDLFAERIKILVDISEAIRYYGGSLDWQSIVGKSDDYEVGSFAYYSLYLAKEMMDAEVPTGVSESLRLDPRLSFLEAKLLGMILKKNVLRCRKSFFLLYTEDVQ